MCHPGNFKSSTTVQSSKISAKHQRQEARSICHRLRKDLVVVVAAVVLVPLVVVRVLHCPAVASAYPVPDQVFPLTVVIRPVFRDCPNQALDVTATFLPEAWDQLVDCPELRQA